MSKRVDRCLLAQPRPGAEPAPSRHGEHRHAREPAERHRQRHEPGAARRLGVRAAEQRGDRPRLERDDQRDQRRATPPCRRCAPKPVAICAAFWRVEARVGGAEARGRGSRSRRPAATSVAMKTAVSAGATPRSGSSRRSGASPRTSERHEADPELAPPDASRAGSARCGAIHHERPSRLDRRDRRSAPRPTW